MLLVVSNAWYHFEMGYEPYVFIINAEYSHMQLNFKYRKK